MFSEMSGNPGRRQQIPRTARSTCTPACDASYSALMQRASTSAFIFRAMRACSPARFASIVRSTSARNQLRMWSGATTTVRYSGVRAAPVRVLKSSATSAAICLSQVKRPKSS
jgi:hypothetical protein